jgi:glucose-1-phosphate thymidylyltransferase
MKLIVLAAGYATRLYPLTLDQPKPLLDCAGKPMLEHVLENLATIPYIDHAYVVTNEKFAGHFEQWASGYKRRVYILGSNHKRSQHRRLKQAGYDW